MTIFRTRAALYSHNQYQIRAAVHVNSELIRFYWSLGRDIVKMKSESKWGNKFYESLSKDLKNAFNDAKGFSTTNLKYMRQFYELFSKEEISQQVVDQIVSIPWGHIIAIIHFYQEKPSYFIIKKTRPPLVES